MKKQTVIVIIILIIVIIFSIIFSVKQIKETSASIGQEEIIKNIEYEIYSNENNILKLLIVATDTENGIQEIEYPDGDKLKCNGKTQVGIDYVIEEDGIYRFKSVSATGERKEIEIQVDEDFRANKVMPIEMLQEISTEKDYKVNYNYKRIESKCYYAIGENNEEWIETDRNIINIDEYDAFFKEQLNEDKSITLKLKKEDNDENKVEIHYKLNEFNVPENLYNKEDTELRGESIIACVRDNEIKSGNYKLVVNEEEYLAEIYNYDEDVNYITNKNLGTVENDNRMVIMKYNKNLNINEENLITAQARKKGMFIYVGEELINSGEISMTARGAKAEGQNVYLWKHKNGTYEYVPAEGAEGAEGVSSSKMVIGNKGINGNRRQTAGGGSGAVLSVRRWPIHIGKGGKGTSYSGGTGSGSGGIYRLSGNSFTRINGLDGESNGGAGGEGYTGGTGNPGGTGRRGNGTNGTGGLLILYANKLNNKKDITAKGTDSNGTGGASGGGSINIFYNETINQGTVEATGGNGGSGGNGGDGLVTFFNINCKSPNITVNEITNKSCIVNIEETNIGIEGIVYDYYINDEIKVENTTSISQLIQNLEDSTNYEVKVVAKFERNEIQSNIISITTKKSPRLQYPILTSKGFVNAMSEDGNYYLDNSIKLRASNAIQTEAFDNDLNTYFCSEPYKYNWLKISQDMWGKYLTFNYETNDRWLCAKFYQLEFNEQEIDSNEIVNTIQPVSSIDFSGPSKTRYTKSIKIPENCNAIMINSGGSPTLNIFEVWCSDEDETDK